MSTNTNPSRAKSVITQMPAITISITIVQVGEKVSLSQLSSMFDIFEKLHIL
jgi:drug/metabolite transporter (DMT)-like permease